MSSKFRGFVWVAALGGMTGAAWLLFGQNANQDRLWQFRNLGKAFYENPTTHKEAVDELRQALALDPNSVRDQLNYALALLRQGEIKDATARLQQVQKLDPKLPHTWFNLGIIYKQENELDQAQAQFQEMIRLVPNEPIAHYQLGVVLKAKGDTAAAIAQFEAARDLNPRLAAAHFQLFGLYRQTGRAAQSAEELRIFQDLKKQQEGAAVPEDVEWCQYAELYDPIDAPFVPPPPPTYREEKLADGFTGPDAGVTVLTAPGGHPDLIAWSPGRVALFRGGRTLVADSGLQDLRDVRFIAPGDFDNDGLPDLCIVTAKGVVLYRNTGTRFVKHADLAAGSFRKAVWIDYDHDYDEDVVLVGDDQRLLRNNSEAGFSDETKRFPFVSGRAIDAVRFDLEPDTPGFDLVVSYAGRPGVLYRDKLGGNYQAVPIDALPPDAHGLVAADVNHDGFTDLEFAPAGLLLNRSRHLEISTLQVRRPFPATYAAADFNGSGRLDWAGIKDDGALVIERDTTPAYGHWIEISLTGVKNAKLAMNAKVEVKAGSSYEKQTYSGVPLVFRLGNHTAVETVRITWPNGLIQNETKPPVDRVLEVKEAPRLSGSCPMIFTWNGSKFHFVTDVLGVAPLGASSGDGQYFPVDHQEYVSVPAALLQPRDGSYEIRMTEELREVSYIDQIKLTALDHPADTEIVTNEKFKSPPFPEFRLYGSNHRIYPTTAHDSRGADVRPALLARDRRYPNDFRRDHAGVADLHTLDLNFAGAAADGKAALMLYGWVDWADGSTFLSATEAHRDLVFPYLQVKDAQGNWKTVIEDMGMPSGKPKPMAVDLTGKFLSASREIRVVTNLCVYWDEIYLIENAAPPPSRLTGIPLASADLHFRGFSRVTIDPERKQPESFDYDSVSPTSMWNPTPGNYTRYGVITDLLREPDDRMVIMGSGDEIRMRFTPRDLPPLAPGWTRDYLILVDGWAKDADANTAFSQSVLPLPFHAMSRYPYPENEHYPDDELHRSYIRDYLTRPSLHLLRSLVPSRRGTE